MERRRFLLAMPVAAAAFALNWRTAEGSPAQDVEFIRAWERAQEQRPRTLTAHASIAPADEPGQPMRIDGLVLGRDGRSPAVGIIVFAYHTDASGYYDIPSNGPHSWRLRGWAITTEHGRFSFTTIRPAPYPGRNIAAHVHVTLEGPGQRRRATEIEFADDPLVTRAERLESDAAGPLGKVCPIVVQNRTQVVECRFRITDEGVF